MRKGLHKGANDRDRERPACTMLLTRQGSVGDWQQSVECGTKWKFPREEKNSQQQRRK